MSIMESKVSARESKHHGLKFLSNHEKTIVWEQFENEVIEREAIPLKIVERDENHGSNSNDEDEPPGKEIRSLAADSNKENQN